MFQKLLLSLFCISLSFGQIFAVSNQDLLREVTKDARNESVIVDKEAKDIFDDHWWLDLNLWELIDWTGTGDDGVYDGDNGIDAGTKDSLFVKVTRFMVKIAIIAAIPMILYSGIKIVFSMGDEGAMKKTLIEIGHIAIGILLALLAVMIIYVVTSLTRGIAENSLI